MLAVKAGNLPLDGEHQPEKHLRKALAVALDAEQQASQAGSVKTRLQLLAHVAQLQLQAPALLMKQPLNSNEQADEQALRSGPAAAGLPQDQTAALLEACSMLQLQLARVELQLGHEDLVGRSASAPTKTLSFPIIPGRDATPVVKYLESIELSQQAQAGQASGKVVRHVEQALQLARSAAAHLEAPQQQHLNPDHASALLLAGKALMLQAHEAGQAAEYLAMAQSCSSAAYAKELFTRCAGTGD
eukprot:gene8285-8472_t